MGAAAAGLAVGGGVLNAFGTYESGMAASEAASYQAQVARNNQQIALQNAQFAIDQGNQKVSAQQEQTAQMIGSQRATSAASGVDPNSGSMLRIQGDTAGLGALDVATIRNNAARSAWGFQNQATSFGAQSQLLSAQSRSSRIGAYLGAAGSMIGAASSANPKWFSGS